MCFIESLLLCRIACDCRGHLDLNPDAISCSLCSGRVITYRLRFRGSNISTILPDLLLDKQRRALLLFSTITNID